MKAVGFLWVMKCDDRICGHRGEWGIKKEANGTLLFYNLWMSVPEAEGKNTVRFRKKKILKLG